jgi:hypothetical protein
MTTKAKDGKKNLKTPDKKSVSVKPRKTKSKTLEELAKEQGVKPFDPSENGKYWPEGADFDEFMAAINSGRRYPRERARCKGGCADDNRKNKGQT